MNEKIGVIADDFTGASDIASYLNLAGAKTILLNEIPSDLNYDYSTYDAIVVALKTRSINPADAIDYVKKSYKFFMNNNIEIVYFKYASTFNSTKTGNIGPVSDYLLEEVDQKFSLIVPSFPSNNRTVKNGLLYVDGQKIENTYMSAHPITPMENSDLVSLMNQQSKYESYNLSIDEMKHYIQNKSDFENFIDNLSDKHEYFYLIPDYYNDTHGELIAKLFPESKLYTGASVFGGWIYQIKSNKLVKNYPNLHESNQDDEYESINGIVLAGSLSKATKSQVDFFKGYDYPYYEVKNENLFRDYKSEFNNIKKFILNHMDQPMLIHSEQEKFEQPIDDLLEEIISDGGMFALENDIRNIVVAGGETSGAVVKKINSNNFTIGESISPGVPILTPVETHTENKLVLKSGNFGEKDFFIKALQRMGEDSK